MFFLHNGTQLEDEKCKFKKLQNKDHPNKLLFPLWSFILILDNIIRLLQLSFTASSCDEAVSGSTYRQNV